ncbi:MAG TPA: growth inhibitor PemK [Lachnospiraceae bacterium]|nr:growth inhibitor PemK [Lachnospiraceae bacterium]
MTKTCQTICKQGDIFMARLEKDEKNGSLQYGIRPVVVVSNNAANKFSPIITILPITSSKTKKKIPTHVDVKDCGLSKQSTILAEQIISISKTNLIHKMGSIKETMYENQLKKALQIQLGLN